jgi:hypothetical protein
MEKEFVSYEIALELKQLDFDEPCLASWNFRTKDFYYNGQPSKFSSEDVIQLPLYQQVFTWFREKYGIYGSPEKFDEKTWWIEWGGWNSSICETYKEAENEWLLKLIEAVKESI